MGVYVQKFGGTSVGSLERIARVAERVGRARGEGHALVVVVSAMAGETNRLLALGRELARAPDPREMDGRTDVTFTVTKGDLAEAEPIASDALGEARGALVIDQDLAKVSIVGLGMRSHAGVAAKMFRILATHGVNIAAISTSEIKVSCLIRAERAEDAVRALHAGFELASPPD